LHKDIAKLLKVQEKEKRLISLEEIVEQLPLSIEESKRSLSKFDLNRQTATEELKDLQVKRKELELESTARLEKVEKLEGQLFSIKTNVEYKALQKEIANIKIENSRIEDEILDLMELIEEKQKLIKESEDAIQKGKEKLVVEERNMQQQIEELRKKIDALRSEREQLLPGIDEETLRKYQRIFKKKGGTAVVPLINYTCGGCHMRLPPQVANNVRKSQLVICENCSRILYWPEAIEEIQRGEKENRHLPLRGVTS
jgi:predicted  nucleic acid-binding Zn-ribbon protein